MAARAGASVRFCAPLGVEPETAMVRAALNNENFRDLHLIASQWPTDLSTLLVADDGENVIISTGDCAQALTPDMAARFTAGMTADDWLLIQGNLSEEATFAACTHAPHIIFNTAPIRWVSRHILERASVVIANAIEAEQITGFAVASQAAAMLGGATGIVTLGGQGCVVSAAGSIRAYAAQKVTPIDTTGAGDIFCGVLAALLVEGAELAVAIDVAQRAAAIGVSRAGCFASFPSRDEVAALY